MPTFKQKRAQLKLINFSDKQQQLFTWWVPGVSPHSDKDMIICDGAVRSGKTIIGSMSFVLWAMFTFNGQNFGIAGKSLDSLRRNLWVPLQQWFSDVGIKVVRLSETANGYILRYSHHETDPNNPNVKIVIEKENYFFLFGGKDEGSAAFLQGFTAAGFFLDECALMPESFVNQAMARMSVDGSKTWFNCNPEGPYHWFKVKFIDKLEKHNALRIQFKLNDNPSLSQKTLKRYYRSFEGVFFQRFVLGEWVMAEGSIYTTFINKMQSFLCSPKKLKDLNYTAIFVGIDWGHSASANGAVAIGIIGNYERVAILDEWYTKDEMDPEECYKRHMAFLSKITSSYGYCTVFAENAEMMMVRGLKNTVIQHHISANVKACVKHEIIDRIVLMNTLMAQKRLLINKKCKHIIEAFRDALWDAKHKGKKDIRLDDGTTNVDSLDMVEYALCSSMKQLELAGRRIIDGTNGNE